MIGIAASRTGAPKLSKLANTSPEIDALAA